jgi:hypothetical protein
MKRLRNVVAAAVAIVALLIAAPSSSLIGMYVRPPIAAYVTQYAAQHDIARIGRIAEQPSKQAIPSLIQELQQADLGHYPASVGQRKITQQSYVDERLQRIMPARRHRATRATCWAAPRWYPPLVAAFA